MALAPQLSPSSTIARFDPRVLTVEIEFESGSRVFAGPMSIRVGGSKTISSTQNQATITISNVSKDTRDYIMSNCNQALAMNYKVRRVRVRAGRESYGQWNVFVGDIVSANVTQPPDITITLRCVTNAVDRSKWWSFANTGPITLEKIVQEAAASLGLAYRIDSAVDKSKVIPRFTFNGPMVAIIIRIQELANVRAYVDDDTIVITDWAKGLSNTIVEVNAYSGMVGIPEMTEYGVKVKTLADRNILLGGAMRLKSEIVPVLDGDYVITRIDYDLTTREQEFYFDVWASRSA